jgi:predicted nucleic acid-binding protein
MKTIVIDANVMIRFLLADHPRLSPAAKSVFLKAQNGKLRIYLDEVIVAEVVWTLSSFYKIKRKDIGEKLEKLISQDWIINPKKDLILSSLSLFVSHNLDYIDCWIYVVAKDTKLSLETFDKDLKRLKFS